MTQSLGNDALSGSILPTPDLACACSFGEMIIVRVLGEVIIVMVLGEVIIVRVLCEVIIVKVLG